MELNQEGSHNRVQTGGQLFIMLKGTMESEKRFRENSVELKSSQSSKEFKKRANAT